MEGAGPATNSSCTCDLQFGVYPLSSQDSQTLNLPEEFSNLSINFHGPAGENQRILAKEKIEEIKQKVVDYYFDPDSKVIAIPNHFVTPKKPNVIGNKGREKQDDQILDRHLEERLHHELVNAARNSNLETFIINSFQSADCIQQLVKKGKDTRGKDKYAEFNQYEKRVKEIFDIEDVEEENLKSCIDEHIRWRENPLQFQGPDNWLFKQVLKCQVDRKRFNKESAQQKKNVENNQSDFQNMNTDSSNTDQCSASPNPNKKKLDDQTYQKANIKIENTFLYKIPNDKLRNFYKYQFYNFSLQEKKTEWDTIMIVPEYSAIINIEVKRGCNDSNDKLKLLKDAADQTKQHFLFIQKLFGGILSKDWVFVRAACVPYLNTCDDSKIQCVNCQQFILRERDVFDVSPWMKHLLEGRLVTSQNYDQNLYLDLVAELIYHISLKESSKFDKLISDPLTVSREAEKALTGKTDGISGESFVPDSMLTDEQKALIGKAKGPSKKINVPDTISTNKQHALAGKATGLSKKSYVHDSMLTNEQNALGGKATKLSEMSDVSDPVFSNQQKALTDFVDDEKAVYMLNNEQLQALYSPAKFLIIDGDYGTGKTYVLKERAKKCATDNHENQIFYIDLTGLTHTTFGFETTQSSVMDILAITDFDCYPNIRVITINDIPKYEKYLNGSGPSLELTNRSDITDAISSFLRDSPCDHLFIDEMIIGNFGFPDSIETICVNLKVNGDILEREPLRKNEVKNAKAIEWIEWIETKKVNCNAVHVNLTKNMRNSQQIIHLAKALEQDSTQQMSPDTNVMGTHNFYYRNVYDISPSLLAFAAVNKYFIHNPKESFVILSYSSTEIFELLNKQLSSTIPVVRDFKAYIKKPEGILVTSIHEFQGAQARNIIICDTDRDLWLDQMRNKVLRAMSHAIIILKKQNEKLNSFGAIEDKNLHKFIYPEGKAPKCHHYHNKYKHDISSLTMAILEKYKLFDHDESIAIITYSRTSKDIIRGANTKEFLSLSKNERKYQVKKKIESENKELYEFVKKNISRNNADIFWSYHNLDNNSKKEFKDLVNKPRHINYINMEQPSKLKEIPEFKNIIVFADETIDHKHEFAAWGNENSLKYSDNEISMSLDRSNDERNKYDTFCRDVIMLSQPKFAIVVHDGNFKTFCQFKGALNLIEDDNLHEHRDVTNTEL